MATLNQQPIYDPKRTFDDNFDHGPFGAFASPKLYRNQGKPKHSFLGIPIYEPFGVPAGPLPTARHVSAAFARGFDVVVYKSQRSVPFECNPFPNVIYVNVEGDLTLEKAKTPLVGTTTPPASIKNLTITNSFAMPSRGPKVWVPDLKTAVANERVGQLLVMSVVGTIQPGFSPEDYYDDFTKVAKLAASTGVRAIEVNLSCPNVANEGILCYDQTAVRSICSRVKVAIGDIPLIVKLGYFSRDQDRLLHNVINAMAPYVDAVSVLNTIPAPVVDEAGNQALPGPKRLSAGICGAAIKWAGVEMVARLHAMRKNWGYTFEIVGVGGVMTPKDYLEYRAAGADVVQSATGAMWDPELATKIKRAKLSAARGKSVKLSGA